jgi:hypothetical protein
MISAGYSVYKKDASGKLIKDEFGNNVVSETAKTIFKALAAGGGMLFAAWLLPKLKRAITNFTPMQQARGSTGDYMMGYNQTVKQQAKSGLVSGANYVKSLGQGINPMTAVAIAGAAVTDYNRVVREIINDPTQGITNNFVELSLAATAAATPLGRIVLLFNMLAGAGFLTNPSKIMSGETQRGEMDKGVYSFREKLADKILNNYYRYSDNANPNMIIDTDVAEQNIKSLGQKNQNIVLNLETNNIVGGDGSIKNSTKVNNRDPYGNTFNVNMGKNVTKQIWKPN